MARSSSLGTLLTCVGLLACGETHVTLLEPILGHGGSGSSVDASVGGHSGATNDGDAGAPPAHLIHRYNFDGDGTLVADSIGLADGIMMGGAKLSDGHVTLDGMDDYVDLPNNLLSGLSDATLVAWLSWDGGKICWQRVFDFGSSDAGEGTSGNATSSLFATPLRCGANADGSDASGPATAFERTDVIAASVDSDRRFPVLNIAMFAVAVDSKAQELRMYAAGERLSTNTGTAVALSQLIEENEWLGRSQWSQDHYLRGSYDEFRIYDVALSHAQLAALEAAGQDTIDH